MPAVRWEGARQVLVLCTLASYVEVLNSKWVLIPKVAILACLHHTTCPPTAGISRGERQLNSLQSLFTFSNAS